MTDLTPEDLHEFLWHEDGKLYWRERDRTWFKTDRTYTMWNTRYSYQEAFTAENSEGYKQGRIFYKRYSAHRVIWALEHGEWPDEIDHINGVPYDNRLENLRSVTHAENLRNRAMPTNNTSGIVGVYWDKREGKWQARIQLDNRAPHLGYFDDKDAAIAARKQAEIEYGFHENHGRT